MNRIGIGPPLIALGVSALGGWYHNVRGLPGMPPLAPEMVATLLPALVLFGFWIFNPGPGVWWATLVWALLNLVWAPFSVLSPFLSGLSNQSNPCPTTSRISSAA